MRSWLNDFGLLMATLLGVLIMGCFAPLSLHAQGVRFPYLGFQDLTEPAQISAADIPPAPGPVIPPPLRASTSDAMDRPDNLESTAPLYEYRPVLEVKQATYPLKVDEEPKKVQVIRTSCVFDARPLVASVQGSIPVVASEAGVRQGFWERCTSCIPYYSCACGCWGEGFVRSTRFCDGLYDCLCCPDPCYVPQWQPLADTAFHVAAVRPVTQQAFRWDVGLHLPLPDRSEYFWARADGKGRGPAPVNGTLAYDRVNYQDFWYTFEAAIEKFSLIVQVPYLSVDPSGARQGSGLGDIKFGGKSLFFDCELLQLGGQFLVMAPSGDASRGVGTGHFSLEPSLLLGVRVGPVTYLQGQVSDWIPLRGDPDYAGPILHSHLALNHLLCQVHENWPLIGTVGMDSWTFLAGAYTDPVLGTQRAAGSSCLSMGPGLRFFLCNRIDFGFATHFALRQPHFADRLFTTEFRWRF